MKQYFYCMEKNPTHQRPYRANLINMFSTKPACDHWEPKPVLEPHLNTGGKKNPIQIDNSL